METILLVIVIGLVCISSFAVGARIGQKVVKNEEIKLPTLNPVKVVNEIRVSNPGLFLFLLWGINPLRKARDELLCWIFLFVFLIPTNFFIV